MAMSLFSERLNRSSLAFRELVWPVIADDLGGGKLIEVETIKDNDFASSLDCIAGVDCWQETAEFMRAIAQRTQWGANYHTFTVRETLRSGHITEAAKRRIAIAEGWLYPAITVQAYIIDDHLVAAAWALTQNVIAACADERTWTQTNHQDGATFFCVPWQVVQDVHIYEIAGSNNDW
jgi:hypothetical protein